MIWWVPKLSLALRAHLNSPAASKPWPQTKREARAEILASLSLHLLPLSPAPKLDSSMSPFSHLWGS